MHNLKTSIILYIFFIFITKAPIYASKVYQIPEVIKNEIRQNIKLLNETPSSNERKFELSMSYAYAGRIEEGWNILKTIDKTYSKEVIEKYQKKINKNPNNWKNHFKIAFGYYFDNNKEKAVNEFLTVLKIDPTNIWAMGFIGLLEGEKKKHCGNDEGTNVQFPSRRENGGRIKVCFQSR